jgi:hypothetical protein
MFYSSPLPREITTVMLLPSQDAHRYAPVHVPPVAELGGCGQASSGRGGRCGSSSRAVAVAAGRRLRAPVAVASIAPYRRGGSIGGRRGKGTRHPMPGLCAGPLSLPGLGERSKIDARPAGGYPGAPSSYVEKTRSDTPSSSGHDASAPRPGKLTPSLVAPCRGRTAGTQNPSAEGF